MEFSPAQMLYSRRLRIDIHVHVPIHIFTTAKQQLLSRQRTKEKYFNISVKKRGEFRKGGNHITAG